jgi:flavin-dependent dehydrogenase
VHVSGPIPGTPAIPGVPHVVGVRTTSGEELRADLVVDAMGRRTPSADWLAGMGARPAVLEEEDSGFVYYTRYFTGPQRPRRMAPALSPLGSISLVTLDGDNDTWSVTVFASTGDAPVKALRSADVFDRVIRACPAHAHWLDGQPISDVLAMAGALDRYRRFVVDGRPVVTGLAAVGDSWACTNPSAGRGLSIGMIHAQQFRRVVADHLDDPAALASAWDEATEAAVTPYYRNQIAADRTRMAQMVALRTGAPLPPPEPMSMRFLTAAMRDADVFRALLEVNLCLALPQEVLARPAVRTRIDQLDPAASPPRVPGPDREQLVGLLTG